MKTTDLGTCKDLEINGDEEKLEFKLKSGKNNYCPINLTFIFENNGRASRAYHQKKLHINSKETNVFSNSHDFKC